MRFEPRTLRLVEPFANRCANSVATYGDIYEMRLACIYTSMFLLYISVILYIFGYNNCIVSREGREAGRQFYKSVYEKVPWGNF